MLFATLKYLTAIYLFQESLWFSGKLLGKICNQTFTEVYFGVMTDAYFIGKVVQVISIFWPIFEGIT